MGAEKALDKRRDGLAIIEITRPFSYISGPAPQQTPSDENCWRSAKVVAQRKQALLEEYMPNQPRLSPFVNPAFFIKVRRYKLG